MLLKKLLSRWDDYRLKVNEVIVFLLGWIYVKRIGHHIFEEPGLENSWDGSVVIMA